MYMTTHSGVAKEYRLLVLIDGLRQFFSSILPYFACFLDFRLMIFELVAPFIHLLQRKV